MSTITKSAVTVPTSTSILPPEIAEKVKEMEDAKKPVETTITKLRHRTCKALEDCFPNNVFQVAGSTFDIDGDQQINPAIIEVLSDTPQRVFTLS